MAAILIVDDEPVLAHQLAVALRSNGHEVTLARDAGEGLAHAQAGVPDLVLLDLRLPDRSGLELLPDLLALDPALAVVLMTAYGTDLEAVEAIRLGAADYLPKPLNLGELGLVIERLMRDRRTRGELTALRAIDRERWLPPACFGVELTGVLDEVERLCDRSVPAGRRPPLLLEGPPGSGRLDLAYAIHARVSSGPILRLDCRSPDPGLLAEHLCGVEADPERGLASRVGLAESADGGTLLVEEVTQLPAALQAALLELLDHGRIRRVGAPGGLAGVGLGRARSLSIHLIATTTEGLGRPSSVPARSTALFERLSALSFTVPPLHKRPDDVARAARWLAERAGHAFDARPRRIGDEAIGPLLDDERRVDLPELRNVVEQAVRRTPGDEIEPSTIRALLSPAQASDALVSLPPDGLSFEAVERDLIRQALERSGGNRTRAARLVGMSRDTFRYRMARLGVEPPGTAEEE